MISTAKDDSPGPPTTAVTAVIHSTPQVLAEGTTDEHGDWSATAALPASLAAGVHTITIQTSDGTQLAGSPFIVSSYPTAVSDSASTRPDESVVIPVLANDSAEDELPENLTVATTSAASGVASTDGKVVTYRPAAGFSGVDSGSYQVCDPTGRCSTGVFSVNVTAGGTTSFARVAVTGRRTWSGEGSFDSAALATTVGADGSIDRLTGVLQVPTAAGGQLNVTINLRRTLWWTFGSLVVADQGSGNKMTGFVAFAPLVKPEPDQAGKSIHVEGFGPSTYRHTIYQNKIDLRVDLAN